MNTFKKTILTLCAIAAIALTPTQSEARRHHYHGGFRGHHHYSHHHHHSFWGRGGRHFWPGFVGGIVGGTLLRGYTTPIYTAPVVYSTPVVTTPTVQYVQQQPVYTTSRQPQVIYVNSTTEQAKQVTTEQPRQQETIVLEGPVTIQKNNSGDIILRQAQQQNVQTR